MTTHTENLRKISVQLKNLADSHKALYDSIRSLSPVIQQISEQLAQETQQAKPEPIQSPLDLIQAFKRLSENPTPNTARVQSVKADALAAFNAVPEGVLANAKAAGVTPHSPIVNVQTIPGHNLTEQARHLLRNGHTYNDAIQLLQLAHPSKTREHVRRAAGRARDTK